MAPVRKNHLDALAVSLLLFCCLCWAFQQVLVKATIAEVAPVFQASVRFAVALVLLLAWCRWRGIRLFEADGSFWPGVLAGLLFACEFAGIYMGLQYTAASRLTVFLYTSPFWVAVLLPLFVRSEHLRPLQWLGLLFAFCAVAFALREGFAASAAGSASQLWLGDLLGLMAGASWGLTTVVIRATSLARLSAEKLLLYQVAVSTLALPVLSVALGERWAWDFSIFAWSSIAFQAVVGAFLSYLAWMWMLGRYPATKISAFVFLTPIFALVFGALWLAEPVTPSLLAALALVAVGIVLVNRRPAA